MFKKTILAVAALAITAGSLGASTTSASAHSRRYIDNNYSYDYAYVCKPVFEWKWIYRHYEWQQIKVKVGETCDWVKVVVRDTHNDHRVLRYRY